MSTPLPVAPAADVRRHVGRLLRRHRREVAGALALHAAAAASALAGPYLVAGVVADLERGIDGAARAALLIVGFLLVQGILTRFAVFASARLGQRVLADLREEFVGDVLALPLAAVERAGSGDLVTRMTRDVDRLSLIVRRCAPEMLIALITILVTLVGLALVSPLLALPSLVAAPVLWTATRWYLARSRAGYLRENASYSALTEGLTETVEGARTVEAFQLAGRRFERVSRDIASSYQAERYTQRLRTVYLPISDVAYLLPVIATLLVGGWLHIHGHASLAAVTAAALYTQQLVEPVDRLLFWMTPLQVGAASLARLLGVRRAHDEASRPAAADELGRGPLVARGVSYAYREGRDVLHHIDLEVRPGERLALVGSSGAGKSTLGRLLAGIDQPRAGSITVGGVPLSELPLEALRRRIALVTQEHHVFCGSLRDNLAMARPAASDAELERALRAVDGWEWASALGLDARVGSGGEAISPAQAQQVALARLLLADPDVLILDEATSLLDPRAARHLERSLAAVLAGRTVIAIAHRLHTAHDADRIAMMEGGRIVELGRHDDLVARGGDYAALWRSWQGEPARSPAPPGPAPLPAPAARQGA